MIAYHYPPCRGSSGLQRTLSFSRHLPAYGWTPIVLTAAARAYAQASEDQLVDTATVMVERAFAFDTARHLCWHGRYLSWTALPDRWVSWLLWAIPLAMRLIRKYKPRVIWSTYPIATAHLIALTLHRLTGIPWVADFRDPMIEVNPVTKGRRPSDPLTWRVWSSLERSTVKHCSRAVFTTDGARVIYKERYPAIPTNRWTIISNGYDEDSFVSAERIAVQNPPASTQPCITLLHSGVLYRSADRDPSAFFAALAKLKGTGAILPSRLRVVLRASGYEREYRSLILAHGIEDVVCLEPAVSYREALAEMMAADGLLIFQGYTSNPAIPAKLYEYLRARRPIFAMVDSAGETAKTLRAAGVGQIVPLGSEDGIASGLVEFLQLISHGKAPVLDSQALTQYARALHAQQLAGLMSSLA